jgi:predicted SAM-dependent methyltransferase
MTSTWSPANIRALARAAPDRATLRLRRAYYIDGRLGFADRLPGRVRRLTGLDDLEARDSRRLELGSGSRPTRGHIHADTDPWAQHLEFRIRKGAIPIPDGWADEILAIHVLEHIHPTVVVDAVCEWRRCLRLGGLLKVHVPDSRRLCARFAEEPDIGKRWALMGALNGMYANHAVRDPKQLHQPADHQVFFDADTLRWVLSEAGLREIRDVSATETDVHSDGWAPLIENISLIFTAKR